MYYFSLYDHIYRESYNKCFMCVGTPSFSRNTFDDWMTELNTVRLGFSFSTTFYHCVSFVVLYTIRVTLLLILLNKTIFSCILTFGKGTVIYWYNYFLTWNKTHMDRSLECETFNVKTLRGVECMPPCTFQRHCVFPRSLLSASRWLNYQLHGFTIGLNSQIYDKDTMGSHIHSVLACSLKKRSTLYKQLRLWPSTSTAGHYGFV